MICKPCGEAGNMLARLGAPVDYVGTTVGVAALAAIQTGHEKCKGSTWCDCQHVIPMVTESRK